MTRSSSISKRYATALAESIPDAGELETIAAELVGLVNLFDEQRDLTAFVRNRGIPKEKREQVLESVLTRLDVRPVMRRFMKLLVDRERLGLLDQMSGSFAGLVDERLNRAEAAVTTFVPLTDAQREHLRSRLSASTGKVIRLKEQLDPDIIGGVIVKLGTTVIDGSVRSLLLNMRKELIAEA